MAENIYEKAYHNLREEMVKVYKEVEGIQKNAGDYSNPVDTDMVKTTKAMFYEKALEILRKVKREEKNAKK